jgi:hypothetical protein
MTNGQPTYNSVSRFQFPVLREFCLMRSGSYVSVAEAAKLDQRSFGSLYHRGWLGHRPGKGFYATAEGLSAFDEYMQSEARRRKHPELPLSHYFDPTIYQLHEPKKAKVMHAHQGAA